MRATSETVAPGSTDAATSRSFSSCDQRRRRSTDVITSACEIVIPLLLGLPLGPAALAAVKQGGRQRRDTRHVYSKVAASALTLSWGRFFGRVASKTEFNGIGGLRTYTRT